jgi:hypothetical protein
MTAIARAKCGNCRCYVRVHCARRNAQLSRDLLRSTERCEKDTFPLTGGHRKPICASHGPRRPMLRTAPDVVLLPAQCLVASPQSAMVKNCTITDTMTSDSSSASRDCRMFIPCVRASKAFSRPERFPDFRDLDATEILHVARQHVATRLYVPLTFPLR